MRELARLSRSHLKAWSSILLSGLLLVSYVGRAAGQRDDRYSKRAVRASEVLSELVAVPDRAPPNSLLADATCVAVVPGTVEAGLGVGGKVGFGLASCRTTGGWSLPTFMGLKGGSFGLQIGAESADIVLVFVNKNAPQKVARSTLDLGGEASVAAGPIGRNVSAETDYRAQAEIYSYSKSKGLFAGIKLDGTKWEVDYDANRSVYSAANDGGDSRKVAQLLTTDGANAPATVRPFLTSLERNIGPGKVE
jgi:SH3 domain-containing YSC84-like protein 1